MTLVRLTMLTVLTACLTGTGCAAKSSSESASPSSSAVDPAAIAKWVTQQNGVVTGKPQQSAAAALEALRPALSQHGGTYRVHVLATDKLTAYAWRGGNIYVSRGLIEHLNKDELAAAIAHEAGHLIAHQTQTEPWALASATSAHDREAQADALGIELLQRSGLSTDAMASMLTTVREAQPAASPVRLALQKRIALLQRPIR